MYQIPPWLDVSPSDFLKATQAGAQLGHAIADSTQRAWEEQARMQMAQQEQDTKQQQLAVENAQQRLAADRLEQYRQQEASARRDQLGLEKQGLGLRTDEFGLQKTKVDQEQANRLAQFGLEGKRLTATQDHQRALEAEQKRRNDAYAAHIKYLSNRPPTLEEPDKSLMGADVAQLKALEKQIGGTEEHGFGLFHPLGGNKSQLSDLKKQADSLRSNIRSKYGGKQRLVYNPTTGKIEPGGPSGTIPITPTDTEDIPDPDE